MIYTGRRNFVKSSVAAALFKLAGDKYHPYGNSESIGMKNREVHFTSDGLDLMPLEYSQLLLKLAQEGRIEADNYSLGGCVEQLEVVFAKLLGKESAIFIPTGTLANHLAIRALANNGSRVITQSESHIYNDSGDCVQTLSNLNLIPMAEGRATFTLKEL